MPTIQQLVRKGRKVLVDKSKSPALDNRKRLSASPKPGKARFVYNRDFLDALDYNRIVYRALGTDETVLNEWSDLYEEKGNIK